MRGELMLGGFGGRTHLNVGGYDLDNQFFLGLATPRKWVSSTVCAKNIKDGF